MIPNQDNLNFPLCLHLKTSSFLSFNNSFEFLKLIMLIFSYKHGLHLPLKLLAVDECLIIFHLICGDSPWSLRPQKYFDKAVWCLSFGLENECLWLWSLFPISRGYSNVDSLPVLLQFHRRNACLVYDIPRRAAPAQWAFFLIPTVTRLHVWVPIPRG